jgi:hypothetical protein
VKTCPFPGQPGKGSIKRSHTEKEVTVAKRPGKLKLGKSSAFVKRRLSWLPKEDLAQEADFCPLPEVLG